MFLKIIELNFVVKCYTLHCTGWTKNYVFFKLYICKFANVLAVDIRKQELLKHNEKEIMLELKFNLKLTKLIFSYILMFHLKKKERDRCEETLAHFCIIISPFFWTLVFLIENSIGGSAVNKITVHTRVEINGAMIKLYKLFNDRSNK